VPAVGWAVALAKYRLETRTAVRPAQTWNAAAIGTSAVAISELLTGLSDDPMNSGVTYRHENASWWSLRSPSEFLPESFDEQSRGVEGFELGS
jgi:hypothetical protein